MFHIYWFSVFQAAPDFDISRPVSLKTASPDPECLPLLFLPFPPPPPPLAFLKPSPISSKPQACYRMTDGWMDGWLNEYIAHLTRADTLALRVVCCSQCSWHSRTLTVSFPLFRKFRESVLGWGASWRYCAINARACLLRAVNATGAVKWPSA